MPRPSSNALSPKMSEIIRGASISWSSAVRRATGCHVCPGMYLSSASNHIVRRGPTHWEGGGEVEGGRCAAVGTVGGGQAGKKGPVAGRKGAAWAAWPWAEEAESAATQVGRVFIPGTQ